MNIEVEDFNFFSFLLFFSFFSDFDFFSFLESGEVTFSLETSSFFSVEIETWFCGEMEEEFRTVGSDFEDSLFSFFFFFSFLDFLSSDCVSPLTSEDDGVFFKTPFS